MSIKKTNWVSNFTLIGKAKINDNSFKIAEVSESGWCYNSLNLNVDCGEKFGNVYANLMGGYSTKHGGVIYVHGKKDDGTDDWENTFTVDWEDRMNDDILDEVGDFCFINVGLETTENNKIYTNKFLSAYDAVDYIKEHLSDDMVVNVRGNMRYSFYKDGVSMQRNITSIFLSKAEPENYRATFAQSVLLDKDSVNLKEDIDKENKILKVHGKVLDYIKEINGVEYKAQYPLPYTFDYEFTDEKAFKNFYSLVFDVKKNVRQVNFEGEFINSGTTVTATIDDVPEDVKQLIEMGLYTEDEILTKYASAGNVERRCVLRRPIVKMEGDADNMVAVPQIFNERYEDKDLEIEIKNSVSKSETVDTSSIISNDEDDDLDWLSEL